ncbi:ferritin-like domain-containing protein [Venenivibrio stagnispumantis]|uniref:Bacterioferritin n=1 Tax=Venenivibrio stagnispumantis TaxID=407998 RepID=A0AA45WPR6_9AQUI|nr:ferritin-like domain-containing protein [Venenivibrio stagnispumantis]MCW4572700.1 ferritin-like domain-containing protein [Venenivibrio stagnispumantis]SMP22781.1 bacterioferritin [Venenivibrio stagnispumantis]
MKDIEREKIIQLFNYNIALEHSAIIQYLFHAYTIKEAETENQLEEIAREEMRHLRMFAHKVVEYGGEPAITDRAAVFLRAPTIEELIQFDIDAELMAIKEYSLQLKDISDESAKRILQRVIDDETAHSEIFKKMKENAKLLQKESSSQIDENRAKIVEILNNLLQKQYQKILEELFQSFILRHKNPYLSDEIEQKAIDKMKHFGWIAEEISESGFEPDVSLPTSINKYQNEKDIVISNKEADEKSSKEFYEVANNINEPDLKWILERISKREIHYTDLERFLNNKEITAKEVKAIISALTVGNLYNKRS